MGVRSGATLDWFLPDLHGSIAASLDASEATVVNAIRYDAYGQTITTGSAGGTPVGDKHWKFQGRLDVSPTGLGTPLYDMSARFYNPGIGAFTQLDSVMGSAQDPLSMNRFLYAAANPWTLSDPTGHFFEDLNLNPFDHMEAIANIGLTVAVAAATTAVAGTIGLGAVAVGAAVGAATSVASDLASGQGLRLESALSGAAAGATFVIVAGVTKNITLAGAAAGAAGNIVNQGIAYAASGGKSGFDPGQVALSAAAGGAFGLFGSKVGAAVGGLAGRAGSGIGRMVPRGPQVLGAARSRLASVGRTACPNSFSPGTLVATASGAVAIGSLVAGELVLGYDEATGTVGSYPISVVHINADPVTGVVVIDGEPIETTPEHPFYTVEAGWLDAEDLEPGLHVPSADGTNGVVEAISWTAGPATMYNLTVEEAHTFFVGHGAWLVHNTGCGPGAPLSDRAARRQAMREQGIPTSQQPDIQVRTPEGRAFVYRSPRPGGGTRPMVVGRQVDARHGIHWEAGAGKTDPISGALRWTTSRPARPMYWGRDPLRDFRPKSRVVVGRHV